MAQLRGRAHLLAVLAHVGEDLRERAHGVELIHVHPGLLGQVRVHVLVADGRHLPDVCIVPARHGVGKKGLERCAWGRGERNITATVSGASGACVGRPGDLGGCSPVWAAGSAQGEPSAALVQEIQSTGMWGVDQTLSEGDRGVRRGGFCTSFAPS